MWDGCDDLLAKGERMCQGIAHGWGAGRVMSEMGQKRWSRAAAPMSGPASTADLMLLPTFFVFGPISEVADTKLRRRQRQRSIRETGNATYGCERLGCEAKALQPCLPNGRDAP
jgi:hypothetical protein